MNDIDNETVEFCRERAGTYRLFATIIDREINEESAQVIIRLKNASAEGDMSSVGERMVASGFAGMADAIARLGVDAKTELAVDYAHVFLNAGKYEGQAAIPYESYYSNERHLLMQDARDQVRAIYRVQGVMPQHPTDESFGETPDDYAVFELMFMAIMNERVASSLQEGDREHARELAIVARYFLEHHICNWSDAFTKDMVEVANTPFYRYFAKAYRGFLMCETDDAAALVDVLTREGDEEPSAVENRLIPQIEPMDGADIAALAHAREQEAAQKAAQTATKEA